MLLTPRASTSGTLDQSAPQTNLAPLEPHRETTRVVGRPRFERLAARLLRQSAEEFPPSPECRYTVGPLVAAPSGPTARIAQLAGSYVTSPTSWWHSCRSPPAGCCEDVL